MKYDAAYFIAKFEAIPEELWFSQGHYRSDENEQCCCALGHCGMTDASSDRLDSHPEAMALTRISERIHAERFSPSVVAINDGTPSGLRKYPQPTPKQRVLAWLRDAKEAGL